MRKIKFRAWREKDYSGRFDIQRGMYVVGNLPLWTLAKMDVGLEIYVKHLPETRYHDRNIDDYILMQFTGLKDKNGKEIYEGDIVKFIYASDPPETRVGKVEWNNEYCSWWFDELLIEPTPRKTMEVIGNIYENPELLDPGRPLD